LHPSFALERLNTPRSLGHSDLICKFLRTYVNRLTDIILYQSVTVIMSRDSRDSFGPNESLSAMVQRDFQNKIPDNESKSLWFAGLFVSRSTLLGRLSFHGPAPSLAFIASHGK